MTMLRVYIVEDEERLRGHLQLLLDGEPRIALVGVAGDAEAALPGIEATRPDVVLCDVALPGKSGIELMRALRSRGNQAELVAYTVFEDRDTVLAALKAGASSYILKGASPRELIEALFAVHDGGAPMSPRVARAVVRELQSEVDSDPHLLSGRERDVLKAIADGLTYAEAGDRLGISAHTVHSHIKRSYEKLHAKDKRDALAKARRKGIL